MSKPIFTKWDNMHVQPYVKIIRCQLCLHIFFKTHLLSSWVFASFIQIILFFVRSKFLKLQNIKKKKKEEEEEEEDN